MDLCHSVYDVAKTEPLLGFDRGPAHRLAVKLAQCGRWNLTRRIILEHGENIHGALSAVDVVREALFFLTSEGLRTVPPRWLELELLLDQLDDETNKQPRVDLPMVAWNNLILGAVGTLTHDGAAGGAKMALQLVEQIRPRRNTFVSGAAEMTVAAAKTAAAAKTEGYLLCGELHMAYLMAVAAGRGEFIRYSPRAKLCHVPLLLLTTCPQGISWRQFEMRRCRKTQMSRPWLRGI
jgi:hypothetical protein